jgi:phosphatidylserine/phosphatidylglycerophosphate/cardiolipin synthase-like enzyme
LTERGLADVSHADLLALRAALGAGLGAALGEGALRPPLTPTQLAARGLGHLAVPLAPYAALAAEALAAVVEVVLAERAHHRAPNITLVWTGEDPAASFARHTRVLLPELFAAAQKEVLIAGYSFDRPEQLFAPLHQAMVERGVAASLFVDVGQLEPRLEQTARRKKLAWSALSLPLRHTTTPEQRGHAVVDLFRALMWPFGAPFPKVYFDPRTAARRALTSLHAKCVVIDHHLSLVTSANFTDRGQTRNLEAGVLIDDPAFARALERQWSNLIEAGVVIA